MDEAASTAHIPQLHLSGGKDRVIPSSIAERWCAALPPASLCQHRHIDDMPHGGAWEQVWPDLLRHYSTHCQ
jgi:pimeloyl-ACP methyl ester carboxylesterase